MHLSEPESTGILLASVGALMATSVLLSRYARRLRVPLVLLFLLIGMVAGAEGALHLQFVDDGLAFRLGTISLVFILFDAGLNTPMSTVRRGAIPSAVLATAGVLITAGITAAFAHLLGLPWPSAMLVGAVVAPTDAAAVFDVLGGSGIALQKRVARTLELESGFNDPIAFLLMLLLTQWQVGGATSRQSIWLELALQIPVGLVFGIVLGRAGRWLLKYAHPYTAGLIPVFTAALALLAYGGATLLYGSGLLAAYVTAIVLGNGFVPYRTGLLRVHNTLAWFAHVLMFLVLGLLILPSRLVAVAEVGLTLGLILALLARPFAVLLCLAPFGYQLREIAYVGWVGLRGAVPIILAIYPVLAHAQGAERTFDVVFFVVVVSTLIPGATVRWATSLLRVEVKGPPPPEAVIDIASTELLSSELLAFRIAPASAVAGATIEDIPLPATSSVFLIVRNRELIAARRDVTIRTGDDVYLYSRPEDRPLVSLLFGRSDLE